eukprot:366406-Chlamydomonas_euryale.AAC.12
MPWLVPCVRSLLVRISSPVWLVISWDIEPGQGLAGQGICQKPGQGLAGQGVCQKPGQGLAGGQLWQ